MTLKTLGAIFVFLGCGSAGFFLVASYKKEEAALRQLLLALDFMECELQYKLLPLPQLCRSTSEHSCGGVRKAMVALVRELEAQVAPDAQSCMDTVLLQLPELPRLLQKNLRQLGHSLGRFDIEGQLQGIDTVRHMAQQDLAALCHNQEARFRCYQALGLCAGSALVVLFL
jgi:stage III sporulation protein AB